MTHSFFIHGVLIGTADMAVMPHKRRSRGGVFHPTADGLPYMPRLCSLFAVGRALREQLAAVGQTPESMSGEEVETLLADTPAGQALMDFGSVMSVVELRSPDGRTLDVESMLFSDLDELRQLSRTLGGSGKQPDPKAPTGRYLVSATLKRDAPRKRERGALVM